MRRVTRDSSSSCDRANRAADTADFMTHAATHSAPVAMASALAMCAAVAPPRRDVNRTKTSRSGDRTAATPAAIVIRR